MFNNIHNLVRVHACFGIKHFCLFIDIKLFSLIVSILFGGNF